MFESRWSGVRSGLLQLRQGLCVPWVRSLAGSNGSKLLQCFAIRIQIILEIVQLILVNISMPVRIVCTLLEGTSLGLRFWHVVLPNADSPTQEDRLARREGDTNAIL